jgi:hypothetical protein
MAKRIKQVGAKRSANNIGNHKSDNRWNTPFMSGPTAPAGKNWNEPSQYKSLDKTYRKRDPNDCGQFGIHTATSAKPHFKRSKETTAAD